MQNKSDENEHSCLVTDLIMMAFNFSKEEEERSSVQNEMHMKEKSV